MILFKNRKRAGQLLAQKINDEQFKDPCVYAIPKGGVPIGKEVASLIHAPLKCIVVKKIGHPKQPELAVCVVTASGTALCQSKLIATLDQTWVDEEINKAYKQVLDRVSILSSDALVHIENNTVILVDDGIATGLSMKAAVSEIRMKHPKILVVAAPVISHPAFETISRLVDKVVTLAIPHHFSSVGAYYEHFEQLSEEETRGLLRIQ